MQGISPHPPTAISLAAALSLSAAAVVHGAPTSPARPPPVLIAYFVPSDRQPIPGYTDRLDRVMQEVQRFYRRGMEAAGYRPMTFRLDRTPDGRLRVHLVHAKGPTADYGRNDAGKIRREVKQALAREGIDIDRGYVAIFEVLLEWRDGKAFERGPFCGAGTHWSGTAWFYDDARLDPRLLGSKKPGGYYYRPCSLGEFNSHYIGGIAHELGHAFGLPHVRETRAQRKRGHALMGSGNHTYGRELRVKNARAGTFLTPASAMLLSHCRAFAGELPQERRRPKCTLHDLVPSFADGTLLLAGRLESDVPVFGISARNDNLRIRGDYDAVGWTCAVDDQGRFRLAVGDLTPGRFRLRLLVCHVNGAVSRFAFDYSIDEKGRPNMDVFRYSLPLQEAVAAFAAGERERTEALARNLLQRFAGIEVVRRKAEHLLALLHPAPLLNAARLPAGVDRVAVSRLEFKAASTGWGRPLRNQVWIEGPEATCFLEVNGRFHEHGLYAHAPSRYAMDLGGRWTTLRTGYALQDGHNGSVVFVVRGDDREIFRSAPVRDHALHTANVDISGVQDLELVVEDAGDGNRNDWGTWIEPEITR